MFDAFLSARSNESDEAFRPFELPQDYARYVDGKLREDGVRAFLASRDISLPEGSPRDLPTDSTVQGLGNRKNGLVLELIRERGVEVYTGSIRFVKAVRAAGLRTAVVSASKNCREVLAASGHRAPVRHARGRRRRPSGGFARKTRTRHVSSRRPEAAGRARALRGFRGRGRRRRSRTRRVVWLGSRSRSHWPSSRVTQPRRTRGGQGPW